MIGFRKFKEDSEYLIKNNMTRIFALVIANALLLYFTSLHYHFLLFLPSLYLISKNSVAATAAGGLLGASILGFWAGLPDLTAAISIITAVILTFPITALYHCASHKAFRPRWLNRLLGEIIGLWHMSSIDEWSIIHSFHHTHSDHPEHDPHPPSSLGFVEFTKTTASTIMTSFGKHFVSVHGPESLQILKKVSRLSKIRQILMSTFWFLLLGPEIYIYFFTTNIVFKKLHYAWFNWATHKKVGNEIHVINQNQGIYRLINAISLNLYNHGSHHLKPTAIRPKHSPAPMVSQKEIKEISA